MSVTVSDHRSPEESDLDPDDLCDILNAVQRGLNLPAGGIEVSIVDDATITELNQAYRQKCNPTNVLSFPQYNWIEPGVCLDDIVNPGTDSPPILWGEVFLSIDTIHREMDAGDTDIVSQAIRIAIHGMLHLFGYDHQTDDQYAEMHRMEQLGFDFATRWLEQKEK